MHLLIPYAASHTDGCLATLSHLQVPNLQKVITKLCAEPLDDADDVSLSMPHERALAKGLGLPAADGHIPWAAWHVQQRTKGADQTAAWAFVTLCHWQAHMKEVTVGQLPMHDLTAHESDALFDAMQPYFAQDGLALQHFESGCWLVQGTALSDLVCASPERMDGQGLSSWLPRLNQPVNLVRLLSEMQMLLYAHPVNDARAQRGALAVNAFWLHGAGHLPRQGAQAQPERPTVVDHLRVPARQNNWPAWAQAWQQLDAEHGLALRQALDRGEPVTLTLCGLRNALTLRSLKRTVKQKIFGLFGTQRIQNLLEKL